MEKENSSQANKIDKIRNLSKSTQSSRSTQSSKSKLHVIYHPDKIKDMLNTIKNLKKKVFIEQSCTICMENIPHNKTVTTRCNHHFCNDCFWKWCSKNNTCPNCRTELMDKNREEELNMKNLLERRDEIIDQVEEYYEESDRLKRLIKRRQHCYEKISDKYNQLENELYELHQEANEVFLYKRNPKKAMKMLDKRIKKRGIRIKREQLIKKKLVLKELLHITSNKAHEAFSINNNSNINDFDDFSDGFYIFNTQETGEYCTSIKCKCTVCSMDWSQRTDIRDASGEMPVCEIIQQIRNEYKIENGLYEYDYDSDMDIENISVMNDLNNIDISDINDMPELISEDDSTIEDYSSSEDDSERYERI